MLSVWVIGLFRERTIGIVLHLLGILSGHLPAAKGPKSCLCAKVGNVSGSGCLGDLVEEVGETWVV
jgi:hypothetical protein